jgi:hypothetical protein
MNKYGTIFEILGSKPNSNKILIKVVETTHQKNKTIKYLNPDITRVWLVLKVQL